MADAAFNLSAEISLQLAKGAAASLRNQIQKGFQAPLEITGTDKAVKQARKDAASKPIAVPITFKVADRATNTAAVVRAIGKIPVEVKFNRKSIIDNIAQSKLTEILGKRKFHVKVEARFNKASAGKLADLEKFIHLATKEADKLKTALGAIDDVKINTAPLKNLSNQAEAASDDISNLILRLHDLANTKIQQFGGGKFFKQAEGQILSLLQAMEKIGGSDALLLLEKKFEGLNGKSSDNLLNSLRTVFKAFTDLEAQEKRINGAKVSGSKRDFGAELKGIDAARESITKLLTQLDSSDPQTFATLVSSTMKEVSDATRRALISSSRDIERFDKLLSTLNQKKAGIAVGAGRAQTQARVQDLIDEVNAQRATNKNTEEIKASARFQELNALLGELKYVDIAARRAQTSIENLLYKTKTSDLRKSVGGRAVGLDRKVADIAARGNAKIAGEIDPRKVEQYRSETARDIANLESRAEKLNGIFGRIFNQVAKFKADGFDKAAKSLQKFAGEVYRLDKAAVSIENIDRAVTSELARSLSGKGLDAKVDTSVRSIERLRNALDFSPVEDLAGAKAALDNLETNLKARTGKFTGLSQNSLNSELSKGLFDVRGMQRFNEAAVTTVSKMQNISDGFEDLGKVDVYQGYISKFEAGARKIAASSDSTGQKLQQLKKLSDNVLINAKLDSEGGFFGSIARSAGLATKRLAAFLVLAQGLYSIQSVLSGALTEAVKVDKEFTKLEQVLNKDFSGNKLEQNLSTLENQIKSLGKTLGVSTLEVANAAQILAQAGIYGKDLATLLDTITKSQLGPSFGSASDTAEAAIAVFRQFNLTAEQTAAALGGINRLSAKYAVEAKGITEAVRRAGGVFSASGDEIGSFSAAFTLVKQKTREADEAIATGLRNIAQRFQTGSVQKKVKELLNVDLVENGEFVGFEESISRIGKELDKVSTKSSKFAEVREVIAGARQGGRISPLITDYKQFEELRREFQKGAKSIEEDVSVAFQSIENKIARATSAVQDLFHEIISSDLFKFLLEGFTQVVLAVTTMLKALNSIPGAILAIGVAGKVFGKSKAPIQAFLSNIIPRNAVTRNSGGPAGLIPGGGPNRDSILAYLTTGEYVLNRKSTKKYGTAFLDQLNDGAFPVNKGGVIPGYNAGSPGGVGNLFHLLKSAGFDLDKDALNKLVDSFSTGKAATSLKGTQKGVANVKNKSIQLLDEKNVKVLAHEFGHIITGNLDKSTTAKIFKDLPQKLKDSTLARIAKRPESYGKQGSATFNKSIIRETLADAVKELAGRSTSSVRSIANSDPNNAGFQLLEKASAEQLGVRFKEGKTRKVVDNSELQGPALLTAGKRGSVGGNVNAESLYGITPNVSSSVAQNKITGPTRLTSVIGSSKGIKNPADIGFSSLAKSVPSSSILASFGKSLISSKQGLVGLGISAYSLLAALGGFESGLTKLVTSMAAVAASMYAIANTSKAVGFAREAVGGGVKNLQQVKARSIAGKFNLDKVKAGPPKTLSANAIQAARDAALSPAAIDASKARKLAQAGGTKGIIGNIKGAGAAVGTGAVRSPAALANAAAAKQMTGLTKYMNKFASGANILSGKFTVGAVAVGAIIGALDFFTGSLEEAAIAGKEKATTSKEYLDASSKGRLADSLKVGTKALSGAATGAAIGASVGSIFGPVGIAVGAIGGGLVGALNTFRDDLFGAIGAASPFLKNLGGVLKTKVSDFFNNLSDQLYVAQQNLKFGTAEEKAAGVKKITNISNAVLNPQQFLVDQGIDAVKGLFGGNKEKKETTGDRLLGITKQKDILDFNVQKIGKDFANPAFGRPQERLNNTQAQALKTKGRFASDLLSIGKAQTGRPDAKFGDLTQETQDKIKGELQSIADVYKTASPQNRKLIIDTYKKEGINIKELGAEVGVVIDEAATDMTVAFDELSVFFTKMKNVVELSSARISGLEGALQNFSDPSKISSDLPDQYFDILKQGFDPKTLGFGDTFKGGEEKLAKLGKDLDPRLGASAQFEIKGRQAARNASTSIIESGATLKNTTDDSIKRFVGGQFSNASGGNTELDAKFNAFLDSKGSEGVQKLKDGDGKINGAEINDLFKEFADSLDTGALDQIQRLNSLSKQYVDQYKGHIAARFALEDEAIGLLKDNVGKRRAIGDVENKAKGLTGDKLAAARGKQAKTSDEERLGLTLQGTGLGGNASVAQMQAALLASQQRGRNAGELARQGGGTQADIDSRRAQIEGGEEQNQKRLQAALQLVASGTDTAAHNMEEFERALEKAANSSKFMTDALLGSDEQMHNTVLGLQAFAKVQEAFKTGGVGAAQQVVATLGEDARQALGSTVGQNADNQAAFNQAVGISSDISASKEAQNVTKDTAAQIEANNALVAGLQDNAKQITENTANMQKVYESQFKNTQQIVQQAEATSKALVDQIANLPDVIKHEGEILVKIEGAAALVELEKGMKQFVSNMIIQHMAENNNKLVANNAGLNKP